MIEPTLDDVLSGGRFEIISIGFVIALWSGSRALNVFVDTITIMYGLGGQRGIVKTRALSFGLYLVFLLVGIVVLPLVLAGPGLVDRIVPGRVSWLTSLYWPIVLTGSVFVLATLYHLAVPVRTRLRANLPGALLTMLIWLARQLPAPRTFLGQSVGSTSIYGPLAAPIAPADLAVRHLARRLDRCRLQRRRGRGVAATVRHPSRREGRSGRRLRRRWHRGRRLGAPRRRQQLGPPSCRRAGEPRDPDEADDPDEPGRTGSAAGSRLGRRASCSRA